MNHPLPIHTEVDVDIAQGPACCRGRIVEAEHDDAAPKTYESEYKGRKVRVTVPPREDRDLGDVLKDHLSPEAVAAIATIVLSRINGGDTPTRNRRVNKELFWFGQELVDLVGGPEECHRLTEEIGL